MPRPLPLSPDTIARECVCLGLKRSARAVARRYDEALRPLELNNGQFAVLTSVAGLPGTGMQALAEHLAMDRTTLTAALKPLQRRGLLEVAVSTADARGREIVLTEPGRALLARAMAVWAKLQQELTAELGPRDAGTLRGLLQRVN
jgi:DNA-binding MarR family transcriptional regulator